MEERILEKLKFIWENIIKVNLRKCAEKWTKDSGSLGHSLVTSFFKHGDERRGSIKVVNVLIR